MASHIFRPSGKFFLSILVAAGIACFSVSAFAQAVPNVAAGCNVDVWNALSAKAEAQVAYDGAVVRQFINKPDSVLTLTCFDQAASVSANKGGGIFSGDFSAKLATVMPVAGVAPTPGTLGAYNCTAIGDLWNTIANQGVDTGAPYATFNDLATGTLPTPAPGATVGTDFISGWNAANTAGIFNNLNVALGNLPGLPAPLNFTAAKSSCDVLVTAGIIAGPCP